MKDENSINEYEKSTIDYINSVADDVLDRKRTDLSSDKTDDKDFYDSDLWYYAI